MAVGGEGEGGDVDAPTIAHRLSVISLISVRNENRLRSCRLFFRETPYRHNMCTFWPAGKIPPAAAPKNGNAEANDDMLCIFTQLSYRLNL